MSLSAPEGCLGQSSRCHGVEELTAGAALWQWGAAAEVLCVIELLLQPLS